MDPSTLFSSRSTSGTGHPRAAPGTARTFLFSLYCPNSCDFLSNVQELRLPPVIVSAPVLQSIHSNFNSSICVLTAGSLSLCCSLIDFNTLMIISNFSAHSVRIESSDTCSTILKRSYQQGL